MEPIPYHKAYEARLAGIARDLREAAISAPEGSEAREYLALKADTLVNGNFNDAEAYWLSMNKEPKIGIFIGFYENYIDDLMGRKSPAMAVLGVLDEVRTEKAQVMVDEMLEEQGWQGKQIKVRVEDVAMLSGFIADVPTPPGATNLPWQRFMRAEHGTKIIAFKNFIEGTSGDRNSALRQIFLDANKLSDQRILEIADMSLFAHEIHHTIEPDENNAEERLGKYYGLINELLCDTRSDMVLHQRIGKDLTEEEWRILHPLQMTVAIRLMKAAGVNQDTDLPPHLLGWVIASNFLAETGDAVVDDGKIQLSSTESVYKRESELADTLCQVPLLLRHYSVTNCA